MIRSRPPQGNIMGAELDTMYPIKSFSSAIMGKRPATPKWPLSFTETQPMPYSCALAMAFSIALYATICPIDP